MRALRSVALPLLLLLPAAALAYQADLVPASKRVDARDIEGSVSITGADGTVRVRIQGVNDAAGDFLDGRASVHLKVRVNGILRRVTFPVALEAGDGEATQSLGLAADDKVIVSDLRVRGPNRRTLAQAGVVTVDLGTPAPPEPPPSPGECPAALESCQTDLTDCTEELDACEAAP